MSPLMVFLLAFLSNFVASMLSLVAWFHFDLNGYWDHKSHRRALKRGAHYEEKARHLQEKYTKSTPDRFIDENVIYADFTPEDEEDEDDDGA